MGLKAIEMQIALPRTHDAGKIQEQLQQRGQLQNDIMSEQVKKEEQMKQSAVVRQEHAQKARFHEKEGNSRGGQQNLEKKKKQQQDKEKKIRHPYKGTKVDFSG